jgi:hypothetical protein
MENAASIHGDVLLSVRFLATGIHVYIKSDLIFHLR